MTVKEFIARGKIASVLKIVSTGFIISIVAPWWLTQLEHRSDFERRADPITIGLSSTIGRFDPNAKSTTIPFADFPSELYTNNWDVIDNVKPKNEEDCRTLYFTLIELSDRINGVNDVLRDLYIQDAIVEGQTQRAQISAKKAELEQARTDNHAGLKDILK